MARRDAAGVRLITRHGNDFTARFPLAVAAVAALPGRSFLIDGEAICTDENGLAVFELIRRARHGDRAVLCVFDLIELNGQDLRRAPIEQRKAKLAKLVRSASRHRAQRALRRRWRDHLSARLQARLRGHRVEAARLAVSLRPFAVLDQGQEPGCPSGEARGRKGLEPLTCGRTPLPHRLGPLKT